MSVVDELVTVDKTIYPDKKVIITTLLDGFVGKTYRNGHDLAQRIINEVVIKPGFDLVNTKKGLIIAREKIMEVIISRTKTKMKESIADEIISTVLKSGINVSAKLSAIDSPDVQRFLNLQANNNGYKIGRCLPVDSKLVLITITDNVTEPIFYLYIYLPQVNALWKPAFLEFLKITEDGEDISYVVQNIFDEIVLKQLKFKKGVKLCGPRKGEQGMCLMFCEREDLAEISLNNGYKIVLS